MNSVMIDKIQSFILVTSNYFGTRKRFILKALIFLLTFIPLFMLFKDRYSFGYSNQFISCIPGQSWYLIDKEDKNLQPGNIYTFVSRSIPPTIKEGELITKYLRGVPGDRVTLNADGVFVNGVKYADKYLFARWMGIDPAKFYGEKILGPNEYWFMGTGVTSFDSRYWGTVKAEQIVGRSYALF